MKIGVLLPTFSSGAEESFVMADTIARAGLDGAFAYDHLWPMGSPERPALAPFSVLAAVARRHQQLMVGPLVARIGLVGTEHLLQQFRTLEALAPRRVIAALGTGDRLSASENIAYGLEFQSASVRRSMLEDTARELSGEMTVWIGGGGEETNAIARTLGVAINLWDVDSQRVRDIGGLGEVTWAGPSSPDLDVRLDELRDAGATWAVLGPSVDIELLQHWRERQ